MLKTLALIVIAVVAVALLYAATRPDTFRVERSIRINATPDKIAPLVSDFHQWEKWSPWEKMDPSLTRTYSGAASGQGAVYAWVGNKDVGQGRMEVVEAASPAKVLIKLDFITPFEAHNLVEFILTPEGNATVVTQAMYGPSPFVSKVMGLVFSMDKMVGGKYEEGLQSLKALAEK
jgi:Polyketide cyclase / dehydrase and lipid transport